MHLNSKNVAEMKDKIKAVSSFNEEKESLSHGQTITDGDTYYDNDIDHVSNNMSEQIDVGRQNPKPSKHFKFDPETWRTKKKKHKKTNEKKNNINKQKNKE